MTTDKPLKLSQQLVMSPQLHLAVRLVATPTTALPAMIDPWRAQHPSLVELPPGEPDPDDARDDAEAATDARPVFRLLDVSPLPVTARVADVWIFGDPPEVRANGRAFPRLRLAADDAEALWLVRALRNRARLYETVVRGIVELRPEIATAPATTELASLAVGRVAKVSGLHESTVTRVLSACRFQNLHGVFAFATDRSGIGISLR